MKRHFAMLAAYNRWANVRLYDMAAALPDELYRKPIGVYFKSLHGTLNHLLTADRIWLRRLEGKGDHPDKLNATIHDDLVSLRAARLAEDQRIVNFVDGLVESLTPFSEYSLSGARGIGRNLGQRHFGYA